jgi:hypothetical protein
VSKITWLHGEVPLILGSAHRHGVPEEDVRHALSHPLDGFDVGEGMTMVVGPDRTGALIEIGVVTMYGGWCVVHAMRPARDRFLRR